MSKNESKGKEGKKKENENGNEKDKEKRKRKEDIKKDEENENVKGTGKGKGKEDEKGKEKLKEKDGKKNNKNINEKEKDKAEKGKKGKVLEDSEDEEEELYVPPTFVYLYMQLQEVENLTIFDDNLPREIIIDLQHPKHKIQKLQESSKTTTRLKLNEQCKCCLYADSKPTFTIKIEQDNLEELNAYCDCPVVITLYQHILRHRKTNYTDQAYIGENNEEDYFLDLEGENEWENASMVPLAEGNLDIFSYFSHKRALGTNTHFLYPINNKELLSIKLTWHIYSLLPLLKQLSFNNIIFITLESIYNLPINLQDDPEDLVFDISFRSKNPNESGELETHKICSFTGFFQMNISQQDTNHTWESIKQLEKVQGNRISHNTGLKLSLSRTLTHLLGTEFVDFYFHEIDFSNDIAIVCNSLHRYALSKELGKALEQAITCNEQDIIIEVYRQSLPEGILLHGELNLTILAYPNVNCLRFAIELIQPKIIEKPKNDKSKKNSDKNKDNIKNEKNKDNIKNEKNKDNINKTNKNSLISNKIDEEEMDLNMEETEPRYGPMFAIISICLLYPLSEGFDLLPVYNESDLHRNRLKTCAIIHPEIPKKSINQLCEEHYRDFDHTILGTIKDIVSNKIKDIEKSQEFYCCHLSNLTNRLTKLISCDFNIRIPTKTNTEFTNLLTTVYKELNERAYEILNKYAKNGLNSCDQSPDTSQEYEMYVFTVIKYANEVGEEQLTEYLLNKLKDITKVPYIYNFYKYLYDIEKLNLESAREYLELPLSDTDFTNIYFTDMGALYIQYMENSEDEETANQAYELLLESLIKFTLKYQIDIDGWILLYCYYRRSQYLPGMEYTRWKFENLYNRQQKKLVYIPITLWNVYNRYEPELTTLRAEKFYNTIETFISIGAYEFAQVIFDVIQEEFSNFERYAINNTFDMLLNKDFKKFKIKSFPAGKAKNPEQLESMGRQVNGNFEYYRESFAESMNQYGNLINFPSLDNYEDVQLGLLRYGFRQLNDGNYDLARNAFEKCVTVESTRFLASYGMGKSLYRAGNLKNAEFFFAEATRHKMYIPDIWGWLALINLKLGENFKALESWKHAKLNPNVVISEEILEELEKINYSDVFLYVDLPNPQTKAKTDFFINKVVKNQNTFS